MSKVKIQLEEGLGRARELEKKLQKMQGLVDESHRVLRDLQEQSAEFLHSFEGPAYLQARLQRFQSLSHRLMQQERKQDVVRTSMLRQLERFLDPDILQYYSPAVSRRLLSAFGNARPAVSEPSPGQHRCYRLGHFYYVTTAEPLRRIAAARLARTGRKLPRRMVLPGEGSVALFPGHPEQYDPDGPSAVIVLQGKKKLGLWIDEELPPLDIHPYLEEMEVSRKAPYPVTGRFRKRGQQHYLLEP